MLGIILHLRIDLESNGCEKVQGYMGRLALLYFDFWCPRNAAKAQVVP